MAKRNKNRKQRESEFLTELGYSEFDDEKSKRRRRRERWESEVSDDDYEYEDN